MPRRSQPSTRRQRCSGSSTGHFPLIDYYYYAALTVAALYENASAVERPRWGELLELRDQLRTSGRTSIGRASATSTPLYRRRLPASNGRSWTRCVSTKRPLRWRANMVSCRTRASPMSWPRQFYTACGFETIANAYLRNAKGCYLRWGADGKVSSSIGFIRNWLLRWWESSHGTHWLASPAARYSERRQSLSGRVQRDRPLISSSRRFCGSRSNMPAPSVACLILFPSAEPRIAAGMRRSAAAR